MRYISAWLGGGGIGGGGGWGGGGGGGGHLRAVLVKMSCPGFHTLTLFKRKSVHFVTLFKTVAQMLFLRRLYLFR